MIFTKYFKRKLHAIKCMYMLNNIEHKFYIHIKTEEKFILIDIFENCAKTF